MLQTVVRLMDKKELFEWFDFDFDFYFSYGCEIIAALEMLMVGVEVARQE